MRKLRVGVLMGGKSSERQVSLVSGKEVVKNLDKKKYEVVMVDVPRDLDKITNCRVAFIAMHGKGGEDGVIQGYLESLGIKYTGCGVLASAIGMNKKVFRALMEKNKVRMAKITDKIPCVVKSNNGGSSVGVSIVKDKSQLKKAVNEAKKYDKEIIIEEYIKGTEVSCGVLGNEKVRALPVIEICPKNDFFDYEAKYTDGRCQEICPARISKAMTKKVQKLAVEVFEIIGGRGFARIDMIIKNNLIYVLEINTIPGLTPNSLLPKEARVAKMSYSDLLDRIIELSQA